MYNFERSFASQLNDTHRMQSQVDGLGQADIPDEEDLETMRECGEEGPFGIDRRDIFDFD